MDEKTLAAKLAADQKPPAPKLESPKPKSQLNCLANKEKAEKQRRDECISEKERKIKRL
jgi:hypothetical protein